MALDTEPRRPARPVQHRREQRAAAQLLDSETFPVQRCIELSLLAGTEDRWMTGAAAANPLTPAVAREAVAVTVGGFGATLTRRWCALAGAADDADIAAALLARCDTRVPTAALNAALDLGPLTAGLLAGLLGSDRPNIDVVARWLAGGYTRNQPTVELTSAVFTTMSSRVRCRIVDAAFEWLALASCVPEPADPVSVALWSTDGLPARWARGPRCRPDVMTAALERLTAARWVGQTAWRLALELADTFDGSFSDLFDTAVLSER